MGTKDKERRVYSKEFKAEAVAPAEKHEKPACRSMSRKGNCWDKACAESFFKTLKREVETVDGKHTAREVTQSVSMYLEAYYNRLRMHSALDYVAPNVFSSGQVA
jgi:transposase InsO family protein